MRRSLKARIELAAFATATLAALATAACAPSNQPAPSQGTATLAPETEPGQRMIVTGTVADARGRLIAGATLHVYHQDSTGQYMRDHEPARLEARVRTGSDGAYRLLSVVPGGAEGAPHVHFEVEARGHAAQSFVMPVPAKAGQPRGTTSRPLFPSQSPDEALRMRIESTGVSALAAGGLAVSRRDSAGIVLLRYDIRLR